ncbi:hypothetical protein Gpo141_00010496 [Globisporangium polare]
MLLLLRRHLLLAAIALLAAVGAHSESSNGCFEDALLCPNGNSLSRDPLLDCKFPACPTGKPKHNKHLKGGETNVYDDEQTQSFSF